MTLYLATSRSGQHLDLRAGTVAEALARATAFFAPTQVASVEINGDDT